MNVLSLFDGISCGRLALDKAGKSVGCYFASEIEQSAIEISQRNYPDIVQLGDVTEIDEVKLQKLPKIDLLLGGSPCQGFSRNGKMLNFDDARSRLFFDYVRILEWIRKNNNKDVKFILENVHMKKEHEDVITEYLGVSPLDINSKLVSAQNRPRLYWTNIEVEVPNDKEINLIDILDDANTSDFVCKDGLLFDKKLPLNAIALVDVVDGEVRVKQATKKGYIVAESGDGVNLSFPTSKTRRGRVIKGKSNTLDRSCEASVYCNGVIRRLTINELEKLQTLPVGYTDGVSERQRMSAIGNGWTVDVIAHILENMVC